MSLRVVYLGNDVWSVPPMRAVATAPDLHLELVITRTPRPGRRGTGPGPTPVAQAAKDLGLPVAEVDTVREGEGLLRLRAAEPDVLAVVAYGEILPRELLGIPPAGTVNLHFSRLPRWRGASPVQHTLLAGDRETGVTTILLDEGLDTGPILAWEATPVGVEEDAGGLGARLSRIGGALLARTLTDLAAGRASATPQDDAASTYAPKLTSADRRIGWDEAAARVVARIRALSPQPGATTSRGGGVVKILAASVTDGDGAPGTVIRIGEGWFDVAADGGAVRVLRLASEGRGHMDTGPWLRGARLELGERLG